MTDDMLIGWDEIAGYIKVSVPTAIKYRKEGNLPVVQIFTRQVRASKKEIDAWISLQGSEIKYSLTDLKILK